MILCTTSHIGLHGVMGFNIWKSEFDKIDKNLKLNKLFPHTSLFLTQHQAKLFCINDNLLFDVQRIPKRGGT